MDKHDNKVAFWIIVALAISCAALYGMHIVLDQHKQCVARDGVIFEGRCIVRGQSMN